MKMNVICFYQSLTLFLQAVIFLTFMPYCNFAIMGFSEMKVKSLRFQVNGRGTMSNMKIVISTTSRTNT